MAEEFTQKTILVVDDSNIIRNFVQRIFSDKYNVAACRDGEEAINIIKANMKNELIETILEKLNYSDLQNQFNDSPRQIYNSDMINQNEEIANELADSIYEIVEQKYPNDASKITGMIREMGIEKMNNLMSKTDDLNSLIDQAYEMLKNQDHKQNNNNSN